MWGERLMSEDRKIQNVRKSLGDRSKGGVDQKNGDEVKYGQIVLENRNVEGT